jgi:hypothetical protein
MAARLCPDNVRQTHQSFHQVVPTRYYVAPCDAQAGYRSWPGGRRHMISEEGLTFRGSMLPVLWARGEARELPGGGEFVAQHWRS